MKRFTLYTLFSFVGLTLAAQNLDPTVVVSNNFSGSISPSQKLEYTPTAPKNINSFDINFDYNVFPTEYLGAYDFSPYEISMTPAFKHPEDRQFYLKAGAGYTLRPEFDLVYSPRLYKAKKDSLGNRIPRHLRLNVFASHNSFVGQYHQIDRIPTVIYGADKGYDLRSNAGLALSYEKEKWQTGLKVYYENYTFNKTYNKFDNAAGLSWEIASKASKDQKFIYKFGIDYKYYRDEFTFKERTILNEHDARLNASMGGAFKDGSRLLFDITFEQLFCQGGGTTYAKVHPHYAFVKKNWDIDLGLNVSYVRSTENHPYSHSLPGQFVYPELKAQVTLAKQAAILYGSITGGTKPGKLSELLSEYRFFNVANGMAFDKKLLANEIVPVDVKLGFKGNIGQIFDYNLHGNFAYLRNAHLWQVQPVLDGVKYDHFIEPFEYLTHGEYMKWGAALDLGFNYRSFQATGNVSYTGTNINHNANLFGVFAPAKVKAYLELRYNFNERIYIAVDCAFRSGLVATLSGDMSNFVKVPHYENLGFRAEFKTTRNIGFYIKGYNLLAQAIQYTPYISEKGVGVIAGIVWAF